MRILRRLFTRRVSAGQNVAPDLNTVLLYRIQANDGRITFIYASGRAVITYS